MTPSERKRKITALHKKFLKARNTLWITARNMNALSYSGSTLLTPNETKMVNHVHRLAVQHKIIEP